MKRLSRSAVLTAAALGTLVATAALAQGRKYNMTTVVKITGINWFNRMDEGVKAYARASGNNAVQTGPAQADPAQQLKIIQDLIARKPDALLVVPVDPAVLEPALKQAMDRGIKVITHEADNQINTLYDVEAFDNTAFGAGLNERMAKCMGGSGKWTVFVGSLGSKTHNQWADGGIANAKKYPRMQLVEAKQESNDDADTAYTKAKEILRKYPDIKGFQGSSSLDVVGIGRAVEEAGLQGKTCVFGTSLPSMTSKLIATGAVDGIGFWDPKDAGQAMNKVAELVLQGRKITTGTNLGVRGYEKVRVVRGKGKGSIIYGNAPVYVTKTNIKDYPF